ncbi:MAG: LTA synthase family protein [Proteobacteria bacterium]|nr:MAG: LTA synthase family protein [Pseudomonadota bacterium]
MKQFISILLWLTLFLLLITSSNYLINVNAYLGLYDLTDVLFAYIWILTLSIIILQCPVNRGFLCRLMKFTSWFILLLVFFSAVSELLIFQFSNVGFVEQTFLHFELESLLVGIKVSPLKYSLSILFTFTFVTLCVYLKPALKLNKNTVFIVLFILLSSAPFINFQGSAVGRFIKGYTDLKYSQKLSHKTAEEVEGFQQFGLFPVYNDNSSVTAHFANKPKNLIIIYLESFSRIFTDNDRYPNLTPNIHQLVNQYGELTNYHSTAKYTIQGLISSLCGLVPNINTGNNLSIDQIPYKRLPCLPDVLNKLDYHQEFFGGARKAFANKEAFLLSKNYNRVWGWLDYNKTSDYKTNDWGLQDSDLFNAALDKIIDLANSNQPFNVTLLTLATHLNGNPDPICPKYENPNVNSHKFLDGIHCTDYLLGRFIRQLDNANILDNTTVFMTSDHGVFKVPIIKNLFGSDIDVHQLFGLLINGTTFDKSLPMGLYDMPPLLLDSLEITSNVGFINGIKPSEIDANRFILRESEMIESLKHNPHCNLNTAISFPLDNCEVDQLIQKTWQHAASFSTNEPLDTITKPHIKIIASRNRNLSRLIINNVKQIDMFLKEGHPVTVNERKYHDHIFLLIYDSSHLQIIERSAYRFESKHVDYFNAALTRHKKNDNAVFIIFTEGSKQDNEADAWYNLFNQFGSQYFNFPVKPYAGILTFKNNTPSLTEWPSTDNSDIDITIEDINQYK